jgi:hypothetical protein
MVHKKIEIKIIIIIIININNMFKQNTIEYNENYKSIEMSNLIDSNDYLMKQMNYTNCDQNTLKQEYIILKNKYDSNIKKMFKKNTIEENTIEENIIEENTIEISDIIDSNDYLIKKMNYINYEQNRLKIVCAILKHEYDSNIKKICTIEQNYNIEKIEVFNFIKDLNFINYDEKLIISQTCKYIDVNNCLNKIKHFKQSVPGCVLVNLSKHTNYVVKYSNYDYTIKMRNGHTITF